MMTFSPGNETDNQEVDAGLEMSDRFAAEFDPRLADVWLSVFESWPEGTDVPPELAWFLRMAYLSGYEDALTEPARGALHRSLGASIPGRAKAARRIAGGNR